VSQRYSNACPDQRPLRSADETIPRACLLESRGPHMISHRHLVQNFEFLEWVLPGNRAAVRAPSQNGNQLRASLERIAKMRSIWSSANSEPDALNPPKQERYWVAAGEVVAGARRGGLETSAHASRSLRGYASEAPRTPQGSVASGLPQGGPGHFLLENAGSSECTYVVNWLSSTGTFFVRYLDAPLQALSVSAPPLKVSLPARAILSGRGSGFNWTRSCSP
jgi:hypothetical protein